MDKSFESPVTVSLYLPAASETRNQKRRAKLSINNATLEPTSSTSPMSTPSAKIAVGGSNAQTPSTQHRIARKLIAAVGGSSSQVMRLAVHPIGASVFLAFGYMILCGAYIILSGRLAAGTAQSVEELHALELLKGIAFVAITGAAYFWFASRLLKRIATQQRHLALIFQGVSDPLFLLHVEPNDCYRFLCVNASFLKITGLTKQQVDGKRIEEVLPQTSVALAMGKYQEAIREHKTVSWEECASYPAGRRVGEVTVTPLTDKTGKVDQLAGVIRDITDHVLAWQKSETYGRKLQVLSHRLVEVQETERRRIARELHDEIGQALTVAQLNLQAVLQSSDAGAMAPRLTESLEVVEHVLEQVHDISLNLRPSMLDDLGLEAALRWYTNRQAALAGLRVEFAMEPLKHRLDPNIETECFRIAQEALTNVVRHAHAHSLTVELLAREGRLHLTVRDDGVGFDMASVQEQTVGDPRLGLLGMEERAALAGGGLEFKSVPGAGTNVHAWFPLKWQSPPSPTETP